MNIEIYDEDERVAMVAALYRYKKHCGDRIKGLLRNFGPEADLRDFPKRERLAAKLLGRLARLRQMEEDTYGTSNGEAADGRL